MSKIARLHCITQDMPYKSHVAQAEAICKGGGRWIQLRVKNAAPQMWMEHAHTVRNLCDQYGARLIINDNVLLAKEVKANGVHLGKQDMAPSEARKILGNASIIGGTANTIEDVDRLIEERVDYIGLGPYKFTTTKLSLSPILGIDGIRSIMEHIKAKKCKIPVIAIGGITRPDVAELMTTGIYGIAVASTVNMANNADSEVKAFLELLQPPHQ